MAVSSNSKGHSDGEVSDRSPSESPEIDDTDQIDAHKSRPSKRRRVSLSSSDDSDTAARPPIAPLSTVSRIRKKTDVQSQPKPQAEEEPVTSTDAREIGLQVSDSTFATLNVAPWLVKSLSTMAIRRPTAIQRSCIPEILKGKDCIGGSRTGSGKTVAFAVPILQQWADDPFGVFAVILTPTR
jgi:ATP-dependent RNA helicase DDX49/DBP8